MNEYILFTKWSLKNPFYVFSYLCKKIFKISQNLITKKINYFNNYNLQKEKITKKNKYYNQTCWRRIKNNR